jgi:hypothetical protein
VTEIYRGQQGYPTPPDREAGPVEETEQTEALVTGLDWREPEAAEEALEQVRAALRHD